MDNSLLGTSTPRFAKTLSWKYAHLPAQKVQQDLAENHFRHLSRSHVRSVSYRVGEKLLEEEARMGYVHGVAVAEVKSVSIGRDGAMVRLTDEGYREAMVGTLSLVGEDRQVLHTIYLADMPEYGKKGFETLLSREIDRLKATFGHLPWSAVADGAAHNWRFFDRYDHTQIIDWWHAWAYIQAGLGQIYQGAALRGQIQKWQRQLQQKKDSVWALLRHFQREARRAPRRQGCPEALAQAITYLSHHRGQMNYAAYLEQGLLIGSGVTESACKTMIKSRFCGCGMGWKGDNTRRLTLLRGLVLTHHRWEQAWTQLTKAAA